MPAFSASGAPLPGRSARRLGASCFAWGPTHRPPRAARCPVTIGVGGLSAWVPAVSGWHCPVCADCQFDDGKGKRYSIAPRRAAPHLMHAQQIKSNNAHIPSYQCRCIGRRQGARQVCPYDVGPLDSARDAPGHCHWHDSPKRSLCPASRQSVEGRLRLRAANQRRKNRHQSHG